MVSFDDLRNVSVLGFTAATLGFSALNALIGFGSIRTLAKMAEKYEQQRIVFQKRSQLARLELWENFVQRKAKRLMRRAEQNELSDEQIERLLFPGGVPER